MGFLILARNSLCSLMICWFLLVPAGVPVLVSFLLSSFFPQERVSVPSWFAGSSWFRLGFRCLSPFSLFFLRKGLLFHHDLLVPPSSGWGSGACLPSSPFFFSGKGFCSIMDFLVHPASGWGSGACLPSSRFVLFSGMGFCSFMDFLVPPASGWGSGACLPSSLFFLFSTGVCQTVPWILNCTWPWWKHALLLFGVYAGVIYVFISILQTYTYTCDIYIHIYMYI